MIFHLYLLVLLEIPQLFNCIFLQSAIFVISCILCHVQIYTPALLTVCSYKTTRNIMLCGYGWGPPTHSHTALCVPPPHAWGEGSFGSGETANQWMVAKCVATLGLWSFSACTILMPTLKNYVYLSSRSSELHQLYWLFLIPQLARVTHTSRSGARYKHIMHTNWEGTSCHWVRCQRQ